MNRHQHSSHMKFQVVNTSVSQKRKDLAKEPEVQELETIQKRVN